MNAGTDDLVDRGAGRLERVGRRVDARERRRGRCPRRQLGDDADAQALDAVARARRRATACRLRDRRRVHRVVAGDDLEQRARRRRPSSANGPIWSRLTGERDEPVAADTRRTSASRRRRRTAPPAGGSSRRCRSRAPSGAKPAATAAALPPLRAAGHPGRVVRVAGRAERRVLGATSPWRTRRGWSCRSMTAPGRASRSTTVASYGGFQPSRICDEHVVGTPRVHMLSLSATGTPASGPGSSPARDRRVDRRRRRRGPRRRARG